MLTIASRPAGVMSATYARDRAAKAHLAFRLRVRSQVVARAIRRFGPRAPVRLLEVGAAEGRTLLEMAALIGEGEYTGVEYDDALRAAHPELGHNVRLLRGDAMSLPDELGDGRFDAVSLLAILEHLPDPLAALREARRVLRQGGLVVATCPNPVWDAAASRLGLLDDGHHVERINLPRLRGLIESTGFEVVEARRFMWAPIAVLPYLRIPVRPRLALTIDNVISHMPLVRELCVNAYVVARRGSP
jgi:ubiquinone/menaquinone biosynthesis C-methylase UbiE